MRYSHNEIPNILKSNLLLFNRIAGSADEMASLINKFNKDWVEKELEYKNKLKEKDDEIEKLKKIYKFKGNKMIGVTYNK